MNRNELESEISEIMKIFLPAKYYALDFQFIYQLKYNNPVVYRTYQYFFERIIHSISVSLILDLCILFNKKEKFSLDRLCNKIMQDYTKSELNTFLSLDDFSLLCRPLKADRINLIFNKIKNTRDEYYAHLDRTRTPFDLIKVNSKEINELISVAELFLKQLELTYFGKDVKFDLSDGELGYKFITHLDEWNKYREKYGLLQQPKLKVEKCWVNKILKRKILKI